VGLKNLQAGTSHPILVAVFWILAIYGLSRLLRHHWILAWLSIALFVGQGIGMAILSPLGIHQTPIFGRYMLATLPWVFIWVAFGLGRPWTWLRRGLGSWEPGLRSALAVVLVMGILLSGPLVEDDFRRSSFVQRAESLLFFRGRPMKASPAPEIYEGLAAGPPGAVVEYPWHPMWRYGRTFGRYQRQHGREVIVSPGERLLWDERLSFRNMLPPIPEQIVASRAAFLVLHLNPEGEEAALDSRRRKNSEKLRRDLERRGGELEKLRAQAEKRREHFERKWGAPDLEQGDIVIWDLHRIRATL
jgi:hypothetical protein